MFVENNTLYGAKGYFNLKSAAHVGAALVMMAIPAYSADSKPTHSAKAFSFSQSHKWFGTMSYLYVAPVDSSGPISGPGLPPGNGVSVANISTLAFSIGRHVSDHLAVELLLDIPPNFKISGAGTISGIGEIASVRAATPTVFLSYYFNEPSVKFRPYVGLGLVYTKFYDKSSTATLDAALGGPTGVDVDDDFGWAMQFGADYAINDRWFVNGTLGILSIQTTATLSTPSVGTVRHVDVDINPVVAKIGFGYRF